MTVASVRKYRNTLKGFLALAKQAARRSKLKWAVDDAVALVMLRLPCTYCGGPAAGLDRFSTARPYIPGNVAPICAVCKRAKGDMDRLDFFRWVAEVSRRCIGAS